MALFMHFKDSKESFYGDNAIQEYSNAVPIAPEPTKKRLKKVHRKDLLKVIPASKVTEKPNKLIWAAKMAIYGFSVYSLQMLANSQFLS